jgi:hypothetical protein
MAAGLITAQQTARGMTAITAVKNGRKGRLLYSIPCLVNIYYCFMKIFYLANLRQNIINKRMEYPVDINKFSLSIEKKVLFLDSERKK